MTAIQRFALHGTIMNPHSSGPYVRHEDHLAAMQGRCLTKIEEPPQPARIVLDDNWKARMLDGRAPERDEMGLGDHPELPWLDEGMMPRSFFAALGLDLAHTSAEDQLDGEVLGAMSEAVNWSRWMPTAPQGDGWKLVSIFDTEDGPVAWWLRELPEAEDGTTTIRNLQAEVEQLKARIARAGAAPAAVAGPAWDKTRDPLATLLLGLARRPFLDFDVACIALDAATEPGMPLAYMRSAAAAPALEAPAAPAVPAGFALVPIEPTQQMLNAGRWSGADSVSIQEEWARKEMWSRMLAIITPPPAAYTDDLVALVENLAQALSAAAPDNDLAGHALNYLKRNGLQGSPLRAAEAAPQAPAAPALGGSAAQAVQALQEMWDDLHKSGSPRVNARAMRYYSDALSTVERALAGPAKPVEPAEPVTPPVIDVQAMKEAFDSATAEDKSFNDALRAAACATIWRRAKRQDGAPDAVGAALVSIATECALHAEERHSYLPDTPAQAATWRPHDWVLQAMSRAISFDHMMNQAAPAAPAVDAETVEDAARFRAIANAGLTDDEAFDRALEKYPELGGDATIDDVRAMFDAARAAVAAQSAAKGAPHHG